MKRIMLSLIIALFAAPLQAGSVDAYLPLTPLEFTRILEAKSAAECHEILEAISLELGTTRKQTITKKESLVECRNAAGGFGLTMMLASLATAAGIGITAENVIAQLPKNLDQLPIKKAAEVVSNTLKQSLDSHPVLTISVILAATGTALSMFGAGIAQALHDYNGKAFSKLMERQLALYQLQEIVLKHMQTIV